MKLNGLAKTAGMPAMGATSPLRAKSVFHFKDGSTFSMSLSVGKNLLPDGSDLEGHPAPIDVLVYPTSENSGRYLREIMSKI